MGEVLGGRRALGLDALAVGDRFRLLSLVRREEHFTYLWILRAVDRLRAVHQVQVGAEDVAATLEELAGAYDEVPRLEAEPLHGRLDVLAGDGLLHRHDDVSRAGSLARYKGQERLESLRSRVAAGADDLAKRQKAHANAGRRLSELKQEAAAAFQRIERHRSACAREAAEQEQAARAAGIEHDDADLVTVKARVAARREDIRQVRERLAEVDGIEKEQRRREKAREAAETKLEQADERREQAEEAVRLAREEVGRRLGEWTERWAPRPGDPHPTPWDPSLEEAMAEHGRAVFEETVADRLLAELAKAVG